MEKQYKEIFPNFNINACYDKKIIAEDLGVEMPEAKKVIEKSGYPSMKVLEFAFDGDRKNPHLPYNYVNLNHYYSFAYMTSSRTKSL